MAPNRVQRLIIVISPLRIRRSSSGQHLKMLKALISGERDVVRLLALIREAGGVGNELDEDSNSGIARGPPSRVDPRTTLGTLDLTLRQIYPRA
jgi:hypothetical protein